jgi:hypothetical protein
MEISRFIQTNQITDYNILKSILESSPYNLKIKEDNNLFLIHTQDNSDFNLKIVNECNGIILDKNTFKIICYTFNKCIDSNALDTSLDYNNLYFETALEGTLIRLYFYNDTWNLSTKKTINASKSKWLSNKSYAELFYESLTDNIINNLNQNYCYSFIITHPENVFVVNYTEKILYHISTRDMNTLNEISIDIGIKQIEKIFISNDMLPDILGKLLTDNNLLYEGILLIDINYNRQKLRTAIYTKAKLLWGNTNNRFYRYLELRKDTNLLNEYLTYMNQDRYNFINYENIVSQLASDILGCYLGKYIDKNNNKLPFFFNKIIYKLHGDFYKSKIKTDHDKIMLFLLDLDPKKICFMINNNNKLKQSMEVDNSSQYMDH